MSSHTEAGAAPQRGNPGEVLRLARENKGWQVAEVATQLNLTAQFLTQLEAGEFDRLPGHTFARGYIRAYAKLLGLEQAALVEQFDRYTGTDATGSTVHSLGHVPEPLRLSRTVLRLASAVLLLLLLLLGYFWWQERPERLADLGALGLQHIEVESADGTTEIHPLDEPEDQAVAKALEEGEPAPVELTPATTGEAPNATPSSAAAPAVGDAETAAAQANAPAVLPPVAPLATPVPAPAVAAPVAAETPSAAPAAPVAVAAGEGLVQINFSADCWVQVADGNGRVLVSVVKHAGETLQVAGKAPLELRLGNARVAQVRYNGEPVEHRKNMTASGTARVNLGQ
ncbi:helix-turn-helix domain-containing protein [Pseudomonas sp. MAP12]|uniref:Helix-turn-helix domain-containing protein n=2 Tax=Geopseudomonas aromaticivorans TaxID=2849492 RepID=A0ABS6MYF8_9GAMM|nr:helix-turn-helix domain-containing protein [Pseudomonas aromaticivorans]